MDTFEQQFRKTIENPHQSRTNIPGRKIVFSENNLGRAYRVVDRVLGRDDCQNEGFLHIRRGRREYVKHVFNGIARARPCADFALGLKSQLCV